MSKENEVPVIMIELVDQRPSDFVMDGTRGTANEVVLKAPSARFITNVSFRRAEKKETLPDGKEVITRYNEQIRYISNSTEISVATQEKLGIKPNPSHSEDKIIIEKGYATIAREGAAVGLYDYLRSSLLCENNLDEKQKDKATYRILEPSKIDEENLALEDLRMDATQYVLNLRQKRGGDYIYNEAKIETLCELFGVTGTSPAGKVSALKTVATLKPDIFMNLVSKFDQPVISMVQQGLQLNIIQFEKNVVSLVDGKKIITEIPGPVIKSKNDLAERVADWYNSPDGQEQFKILVAEIEAKKSNDFK